MTIIAPRHPDAYQVTEPAPPNEPIRTALWGTIPYSQWLHLECLRWKEKWREAWVEEDKEGLVCLVSWREYMKPVKD